MLARTSQPYCGNPFALNNTVLMLSIVGSDDWLTLRLFGRLAGPSAENLDFEIRPGSTLDDLTGVTFVDSIGERSLSRLRDKGARLFGESWLARRLCRRLHKRAMKMN